MKNFYKLRVQKPTLVEIKGQKSWSAAVDVLDENSVTIPRFDFMCSAIDCDIQHPEGSGAGTLKAIQDVESGRLPEEELGGNAWTTLITPSKVWFEGHYSQGEGGEVSLAQYKLAVQTYVQFLFDPERKPIEVPFPAD
jgi:hypothetical protein